jgi:hypothetical protein
MGNRGSKSDLIKSVKEQRVDGSSIIKKNCKVCSRNREIWLIRLKYYII